MSVKPALTKEEWAESTFSSQHWWPMGFPLYINGRYQPDNAAKVAALCLHEQEFGFTREDVEMLRELARDRWEIADPDEYGIAQEAIELDALANRIEALLPPEETS